jgi:anti-sigma B factor antagonist
MWDTSFSVAKNQGSAACRGAELLRVAIDQPMPGVRVVRVAGELDMLTAPQLASCLLSQIDARVGHVVVDISKVTFLGAAGLGSLVKAREVATCHHVELHLTGVDHRAVARPLEITELRPTFTIHSSAESVIARVGGPVHLTDSAAAEAS